MLGLGTSFYGMGGEHKPLIYQEITELDNIEDLDVHFDFSKLNPDQFAQGADIEEFENSATGAADPTDYRIATIAGNPRADYTRMSRASAYFDGTDDILNMANDYETSGKAFTVFWVIQRADTSNEFLFSSQTATDNVPDDFIRQASATQFNFDFNNEGAVAVNTNNVDFTGDGSNDTYNLVANTPTVYVVRRASGGNIVVWADNGIKIATKGNAAIKAGDNLRIGRIGGTTEGSYIEMEGNIGEFGIYDADIGNDGCEILSRELSRKWGVNRHALS